MSFIVAFLKIIFFFLFAMIIIGYIALRKIRKKAEEAMRKQQNPKEYQSQHIGEVELEQSKATDDNGEYADYEEIK